MTAAADLESRLDELRRKVETLQAALGSQSRVTLVAVESAPYLGQALGLTVTVVNGADSAPSPGAPVTLVASWGVLRGNADLVEGTSLATATGPDGTVRVTLRPQVSLDENEDQDALEAMLAQLDPAAASPADAAPALQTLAQQYRWEANQGYRNAVDAYFRDFGQKVLHSAPLRDYMAAWPLIPATVVAYVAATEKNSAFAATVTVQFRDWLGPWLQVYQQHANSQIQFEPNFALVKQQASSAAGVIAGVFGRADILVDSEFGEIGKKVAQQAAQSAIGNFLNSGISDLPVDTQVAVRPILDTGSRALTAAGASVVAALGLTHAATVAAAGTLADKVDKASLAAALAVKADASDMVAVQTAVGAKVDKTALQGKADLADLQAVQTTLGNKADRTALDTLQAQTTSALIAKANVTDLQAVQASVGSKVDKTALDALQAQTASALAAKANVTDLQAVQTSVGSKADKTAFDAFQAQTTSALTAKANVTDLQAVQASVGSKADKTAFDALQAQTASALAAKANVADLQAVQVSVGSKADKTAFDALQAQTASALAAKADQTTLQAALAGKADLSDLRAVQTLLGSKADKTALDTLQTQVRAGLALKADATALNSFQTQTTAALAAKADAESVKSIGNRLITVEGKVR